jgi:hypothetical protein
MATFISNIPMMHYKKEIHTTTAWIDQDQKVRPLKDNLRAQVLAKRSDLFF